jgi:hypothetical protein
MIKTVKGKLKASKVFRYLTVLTLLSSLLFLLVPAPVSATNTVGDKTTTLTITLNDNGTISTAATISISELQGM